MKKVFGAVLIAATLMCCNTPQPTTTSTGTDTGMGTTAPSTMNQSTTTDTTMPMRDTTARPADSLQH